MIVNIKKMHPNAVTPTKAYEDDFCYDFTAVTEEEIAPNVWKYTLGWGCQIDRNKKNFDVKIGISSNGHEWSDVFLKPDMCLSLDLRPRSSIWKTGMSLSCCEATIDEGHIGEISAVFYHLMPNMPRYKVGDRVVQGKIGVTFPIKFNEVDELKPTERGERGYGSSNNK